MGGKVQIRPKTPNFPAETWLMILSDSDVKRFDRYRRSAVRPVRKRSMANRACAEHREGSPQFRRGLTDFRAETYCVSVRSGAQAWQEQVDSVELTWLVRWRMPCRRAL